MVQSAQGRLPKPGASQALAALSRDTMANATSLVGQEAQLKDVYGNQVPYLLSPYFERRKLTRILELSRFYFVFL